MLSYRGNLHPALNDSRRFNMNPYPVVTLGCRNPTISMYVGTWHDESNFIYGSRPNNRHFCYAMSRHRPDDFSDDYGQMILPLHPELASFYNGPYPNHLHETCEPDPDKILMVTEVDLMIQANAKSHHTVEYDLVQSTSKLVIRRGESFDMKITFSKNIENERIRLVFESGSEPSKYEGTRVHLFLDGSSNSGWTIENTSISENILTVSVCPSPSAPIANWSFGVDNMITIEDRLILYRYHYIDPIYILFNPFCEDDQVSMSHELCKEYVLNESGIIYVGNEDHVEERPWNFGQFESSVLDTAFKLLERSNISMENCKDAAEVARKITAMSNFNEHDGVLFGNWSGVYRDGKSPFSWTGSPSILQAYYVSEQAVGFAQCWVYAGVVTTLLRTLGIPCRPVTNFSSGHDIDLSSTIDVYFDMKKKLQPKMSEDAVWVFHVWNEAWMCRLGFEQQFSGWQVVDATPQDRSDGINCCGPAPVLAIKQGFSWLPYEALNLFVEVNADKIYWEVDDFGYCKVIDFDRSAIGKKLITKKPLDNEYIDLTPNYKYPKGSTEEREAILMAIQQNFDHLSYEYTKTDVEFDIKLEKYCKYGENCEFEIVVNNLSTETRNIEACVVIQNIYYTGVVTTQNLQTKAITAEIKPEGRFTCKIELDASEYLINMKDGSYLEAYANFAVTETKQRAIRRRIIPLQKPSLKISGPTDIKLGTENSFQVSFTNPLDEMLTKTCLYVEGLGRCMYFRESSVGPLEEFEASVPVIAEKVGEKVLVFCFCSSNFEGITGSHRVNVKEEKNTQL